MGFTGLSSRRSSSSCRVSRDSALSRRRDEALECTADAVVEFCRGAVRKEIAEDAAEEDTLDSILCRWRLDSKPGEGEGEFEWECVRSEEDLPADIGIGLEL